MAENVKHDIMSAYEKWKKQVDNSSCSEICLLDVEIEKGNSSARQIVNVALGTSKQFRQEGVSVDNIYFFAEDWSDILRLCESNNGSGFQIINLIDLIPIKSRRSYMRQIQNLLYPKYRSFNELYFENKLPHLGVFARDGLFVDGQEVWCSYENKIQYDKVTRIVTEISDAGSIYINTRYSRTDEEYIESMAECMIYAYIQLVLKRYPRNFYGNILFHGNVYERFATLINRKEGLNIRIPHE